MILGDENRDIPSSIRLDLLNFLILAVFSCLCDLFVSFSCLLDVITAGAKRRESKRALRPG